ncbi:hypothetical protein [Thermofilum sp.]|uniref:hypothetical protein n=1 Tax=Thermofilum sp. TaxID=1961369 RepID=UPI00317EC9A7
MVESGSGKFIYWRCPYLRYAYRGTGPYCSLNRIEFGKCNTCPVYREDRVWL